MLRKILPVFLMLVLFSASAMADGTMLHIEREPVPVKGTYAYRLTITNMGDEAVEDLTVVDSGVGAEGCMGGFVEAENARLARDGSASVASLDAKGGDKDTAVLVYQSTVPEGCTEAGSTTKVLWRDGDKAVMHVAEGMLPVSGEGDEPIIRNYKTLKTDVDVYSGSLTGIREQNGIRISLTVDDMAQRPNEQALVKATVTNTGAGAASVLKVTTENCSAVEEIGKTELAPGESIAFTVRAALGEQGTSVTPVVRASWQRQGAEQTAEHSLTLTARMPGIPVMTINSTNWLLDHADRRDAVVTLHNDGGTELTDITLSASHVTGDNRDFGEAVFIRKGLQTLKGKERGASVHIDSLPAGESVEYTVAWTPDVNLLSVKSLECTITLEASTMGQQIQQTAVIAADDSSLRHQLNELVIKGPVTIRNILLVLTCTAAVVLLAAAIRIMIVRKKK
ncbi:MAG: hypothetical protein Q4C54_01000 [Clostridia bacterium]|nr:hypothetical protein [Clostridia bacterium]